MDRGKTHYLVTDICRVFIGKKFYISIVGIVAVLFFSLERIGELEVSVLYVFLFSTYGVGFQLSLAFCAFSYGTVLAEEMENHYIRYSIIRGNEKKYVAAKLMAVFLSSVAVMAVSCGVFSCICSMFLPWVDEETMLELPTISYKALLLQGRYPLWFILYGVQRGIFAGCMSVAATFCSLHISNRLLVLAAPALLDQLLADFGEGIWNQMPYLSPGMVFDARFSLFANDALVFGWALFIAAVFCGMIGIACIRKIRRKV